MDTMQRIDKAPEAMERLPRSTRAMAKPKAAVSWSGGKDSYLALHRSLQSALKDFCSHHG